MVASVIARFSKRFSVAIIGAIACCFVLALAWGGYALVAWLGYGTLGVDRHPDALLDRFMPGYEIAERHETRVAAPAGVTYAAACAFDLQQSGVIQAIFRGRDVLMHAPHDDKPLPTQLLAQTLQLGWRVLAEDPGHELVMGAVTQPWEHDVTFHGLPPDRFTAFDESGYAQIVWTISAEPIDRRSSVFRTITRVRTTDPEARRKFRRYWSVYSPGILLIRSEALRVVKREAERRYRDGGDIAPAPCRNIERGGGHQDRIQRPA
ncbi:MAG: hypothetical protein QOJ39_3212 [Candidatus Eremiobacteraeota bacterium]|jgi:hypothetical protein|nr:hypothetical protein [Candidatus Eremiobacteraeota bacterium]